MAGRTLSFSVIIIILPLLCFFRCSQGTVATSISTDKDALFALKAHIKNDPQNLITSNWSKDTSVCNWVGITCGTRHHRVIGIQLRDMSLTGTIPPHIGNLSFQTNFSLSTNQFHGSLPDQLANLRRLKWFALGYNLFNGIIPSWIGSFSQLQYLDLYSNNFGGVIPTSLCNLSNLETLTLRDNKLSGGLPIGILNISSLRELNVSTNTLIGYIPSDVFAHLPALEWLSLSLNSFSGEIPKSTGNLVNLEMLSMSRNFIGGQIPSSIGNLTLLRTFDVGENMLKGRICFEMGNLQYLEELYLGVNNLDGTMPPIMFNLSKVKVLSLVGNHLSGSLPPSFGLHLPNLEEIYFGANNLHGLIPISLSNASKLTLVSLQSNMFFGSIHDDLGKLRNLRGLYLWNNSLSCQSLSTLFSSLANCINLTTLILGDNPLNTTLPISIGNLSSSLEDFYIAASGLTGIIPKEIGNLSSLISLRLRENNLKGYIPKTIGKLRNLQGIHLYSNRMQGSIPSEFCGLQSLSYIYFDENELIGKIPSCLGNLKSVRYLDLGSNKLNYTIPSTLWMLKDVLELSLSSNTLTGSLPPEIGNLKVVTKLDLSENQLSGHILPTFGGLQSLAYLSLSNNKLEGPIPESLGDAISLKFMDLSTNNFSGQIPKSLEKLKYLMDFNVSFNELQGEIPNGGPFVNLSAQSFLGNKALCGDPKFLIHPCKTIHQSLSNEAKIVLVVIGTTTLAFGTLIVSLIWYCKRKTRLSTHPTNSLPLATWHRISIHELNRATDKFDEVNLVGKGSFGSVYKGTFSDGMFLAVKVFNSDSQRAIKSFDVECEVFRTIRHRNLVKIITSCCTTELKALVIEFMPNWSLEKWLYSHNYFLDTLQRLNIMIDVASALEYLHHGIMEPIVHCDLKPSNVLLDDDMVAHVSDFGIAKLIGEDQSFIQTMTLATVGYMAPEYGSEGLVSVKGDMYSFGILLMETFTRKNPTDEIFNEEMSIKKWIVDLFPSGVAELADPNLISVNEQHYNAKADCISSIMDLALKCCVDVPEERISSKEAASGLNKIKVKLFNDVQRA
ncbi:Receptor kinase-like protein Xa21 [Euphorbia peplus]|nr:Receptor kinase-like protein Xa21 [Euphorbia peplus]